jgi:hypothetical protein
MIERPMKCWRAAPTASQERVLSIREASFEQARVNAAHIPADVQKVATGSRPFVHAHHH